jgi:hemolysin-activating ACP:hemolysin acyltransferase
LGISANEQFSVFYNGDRPAGAALWVLADDLVAKRIGTTGRRPTAMEWKSGTMRMIDIVALFGGEAEIRGQIELSKS